MREIRERERVRVMEGKTGEGEEGEMEDESGR